MIEFFYKILATIGYTHPVHAPTTHIPVGMVIGAFLFALGAYLFRRSNLALTARHCIMLALIALLPTALFGYIDWQHFYAGAWVFPIKMKIGLAVLLLILLVIAVSLGRKAEKVTRGVLLIYGLCLLNVTALGYFGGELVYGGKEPGKAVEAQEVQISGDLFNKRRELMLAWENFCRPTLPIASETTDETSKAHDIGTIAGQLPKVMRCCLPVSNRPLGLTPPSPGTL